MAVKTDRSVFYHIPKTGGVWVKEAMRASGLRYDRCKSHRVKHDFGLCREHVTPNAVKDEYKEGLFSFCFVRHPVSWYKSFWAYRIKTGYLDKKFPLDRIWDDVFERFVVNVLEAFPDGFVTQLYQYYVGADMHGRVDFIGKQECLADDLIEALTLAGETFDKDKLRKTRWRNVSARSRKLWRLCILSNELFDRVLDTERWVIDNFYERGYMTMTKVVVLFYDEIEKRQRRKRLRGENVSHVVEEGFFKITVDASTFIIKEEHLVSLDITTEE